MQARRWREHQRRAEAPTPTPANGALARPHYVCGALHGALSSFFHLLARAFALPVIWAGHLALQLYFCCLHNLPGYKAECAAAAAKLAVKEDEVAAVSATAQSAQSALKAAQKALRAHMVEHQALQQEVNSNAQQFRQMLGDQQQQHLAAMHATKEAAAALVSAAEEQSAEASAAADAACRHQASLLAEGAEYMQQLKDCQHQVLALQQAFMSLQETHSQLVRSEQEAKEKAVRLQEGMQSMMADRLNQLQQARLAIHRAEVNANEATLAAKKADLAAKETGAEQARMLDQLHTVYNAEVTNHNMWAALIQ